MHAHFPVSKQMIKGFFKAISLTQVFAVVLNLFISSCSSTSGRNGSVDTAEDDTSSETEPDSETESEVETDTSTIDTGEDENPPDLPSLCTVLEKNAEFTGSGDGRSLSIRNNGTETWAAWTYNDSGGESKMVVQVGNVDSLEEGLAVFEPVSGSAESLNTDLTFSGDQFGLVWLEGRVDWDADCVSGNMAECNPDVAFMPLIDGFPIVKEPIRVTEGSDIEGGPVAAPLNDGWVVAWPQSGKIGKSTVTAAVIDQGGTVSDTFRLSDENGANSTAHISAATFENSTIVMWLSDIQAQVQYVVLNSEGFPLSEVLILDEGSQLLFPFVAAGKEGFLASWGKETSDDAEIFTRRILPDGSPAGEENRITYTDSLVFESTLSYHREAGWGIAWISAKANGLDSCVDKNCNEKAFAAVLDDDGALAAEPVFLAAGNDYLARSDELTMAHNGEYWIVAWEYYRNLRKQLSYGTFVCEK